ncbi:MAG: hypothetical protein P4L33_06915 [Capsulimonadaceae bacterium]|nr:hypothetical protein [Capsulimonadaceae bacterium]
MLRLSANAFLLIVPLALVTNLCFASAQAQDSPANAAKPSTAAPDNTLHLSYAQEQLIASRKIRFQQDAHAVVQDPSLSQNQKQARIKELEARAASDIRSYLTSSQCAQIDAESSQINKQLSEKNALIARLQARIQSDTSEYITKRRALVQSVSPEQKKKILALEDEMNGKVGKLDADTSLSKDAKAKQVLTLNQAYDQRRETIFTVDQRAILTRMSVLELDVQQSQSEINRLNPLLLITPTP